MTVGNVEAQHAVCFDSAHQRKHHGRMSDEDSDAEFATRNRHAYITNLFEEDYSFSNMMALDASGLTIQLTKAAVPACFCFQKVYLLTVRKFGAAKTQMYIKIRLYSVQLLTRNFEQWIKFVASRTGVEPVSPP